MSKAIEAEYLADAGMLKLAQPLEGVRDHERVTVVVEQTSNTEKTAWPTVGEEAGRELALAVRDAFGRDGIAV
jgi:predicted DNA-binding antitoxin AbrB/MazE fold protein